MAGTLYIVSTPIGNLEDITLRALRILKEVSLIACEDTRQSAKLLHHFQIATPTISYHEHNERDRTPQLLARLQAGESIAIISDAGTPLLSDPGFILARAAISAEIRIVPIPGPSALLSALTMAALPVNEFLFLGFMPPRSGERRKKLHDIANLTTTLICYESPHRIVDLLADAQEILGAREAVLTRELTKLHEEALRGTLDQLFDQCSTNAPRGELVLIIAGASNEAPLAINNQSILSLVNEKMDQDQLDKMSALKLVAKAMGISKSEAYRRLQAEENLNK